MPFEIAFSCNEEVWHHGVAGLRSTRTDPHSRYDLVENKKDAALRTGIAKRTDETWVSGKASAIDTNRLHDHARKVSTILIESGERSRRVVPWHHDAFAPQNIGGSTVGIKGVVRRQDGRTRQRSRRPAEEQVARSVVVTAKPQDLLPPGSRPCQADCGHG